MKIAVVGAGFVGSAVINAFTRCEIVVVDPKHGNLTIEEACEGSPDAIFVCVPTPARPDGSVDSSIVRDVVSRIPLNLLVVVKSTITPDHLLELSMGRRLVYNPEFLTQRSANEDFLNADSLILGGHPDDCAVVAHLYRHYSDVRDCPIFSTDIATASLVKYTLNCIFANKVTFMNQIHQLHAKTAGSTWNEFTSILAADSRMGPSHLQVPGPDGEFGFGGACFPKDTKAFLSFADAFGVDLSILREAVKVNKEIRGI